MLYKGEIASRPDDIVAHVIHDGCGQNPLVGDLPAGTRSQAGVWSMLSHGCQGGTRDRPASGPKNREIRSSIFLTVALWRGTANRKKSPEGSGSQVVILAPTEALDPSMFTRAIAIHKEIPKMPLKPNTIDARVENYQQLIDGVT
ncbi:MAG: hypothetical protein EBE86_028140 [Hormoscilla sp. GUM202]|nr:hypothetical protein [Hormoscilla sp. GUM202]